MTDPTDVGYAAYSSEDEPLTTRAMSGSASGTGISATVFGSILESEDENNMQSKLLELNATHQGLFESDSDHEAALLDRAAKLDPRNRLPRLVQKGGLSLTGRRNIPGGKRRLYWTDWFHTYVHLAWWKLFAIYGIIYLAFWAFFAVLFLPMAYEGGTCTSDTNVDDFYTAFMLSVEVASTIGFGNYSISNECSFYGVVILMLQVLVSLTIDSVFIGAVYAKMAQPYKRAITFKFSDCCVINYDTPSKVPQLQVRVGDVRPTNQTLIDLHARFSVYEHIEGPDGFDIIQTDVMTDGSDYKFSAIPMILTHTITQDSPMKKLIDDPSADIEVVIILEGTVSHTGNTTHTRESYLKSEIKHNHRFLPMLERNPLEYGPKFVVNFAKISNVAPNP